MTGSGASVRRMRFRQQTPENFAKRMDQSLAGLSQPEGSSEHCLALKRLCLLEKKLGGLDSRSVSIEDRTVAIKGAFEKQILSHLRDLRNPETLTAAQLKRRVDQLRLLSNQIQQLELILKMEKFGLLPRFFSFLKKRFEPNVSAPPC